jgi:hypothetical protein
VLPEEPVARREGDLALFGLEARGRVSRAGFPVHGEPPVVKTTPRFGPPAADRVLADEKHRVPEEARLGCLGILWARAGAHGPKHVPDADVEPKIEAEPRRVGAAVEERD